MNSYLITYWNYKLGCLDTVTYTASNEEAAIVDFEERQRFDTLQQINYVN